MHILLTITSGLFALFATLGWIRALRHADKAHDSVLTTEAIANKLKSERDRVTVLERDTEALRRELRKLSGKFYAELQRQAEELLEREPDPFPYAEVVPIPGGVCENWKAAQSLGPTSDAAACECDYCVARRAERRRLRGELVPKTVAAQAELAKLNAGKP